MVRSYAANSAARAWMKSRCGACSAAVSPISSECSALSTIEITDVSRFVHRTVKSAFSVPREPQAAQMTSEPWSSTTLRRSEERRGGKEGRERCANYDVNKIQKE